MFSESLPTNVVMPAVNPLPCRFVATRTRAILYYYAHEKTSPDDPTIVGAELIDSGWNSGFLADDVGHRLERETIPEESHAGDGSRSHR